MAEAQRSSRPNLAWAATGPARDGDVIANANSTVSKASQNGNVCVVSRAAVPDVYLRRHVGILADQIA